MLLNGIHILFWQDGLKQQMTTKQLSKYRGLTITYKLFLLNDNGEVLDSLELLGFY